MTAPATLAARCACCSTVTNHPLRYRNSVVCPRCAGELEADDRETARRNIEDHLVRHRRRYEEP